eukprot:SAG11_NODE_35565_length_266_cov_0.604790_1_plen_27_part_10
MADMTMVIYGARIMVGWRVMLRGKHYT